MLPYTPRAHVGGALTGHYRVWWVQAPGYCSRSAYEAGGSIRARPCWHGLL